VTDYNMSVHPTLNYVVTATDRLHVCPYDKSHQVLAPRLCRHLIICRKAYLKKCGQNEPDIQIRRWNSNHHYPKSAMKVHQQECPDRECMTEFLKYHSDPHFKVPGPAPEEPKPEEPQAGFSKFLTQEKEVPVPLEMNFDEDVEDWEPKPKPPEVTYEEQLKGPNALEKPKVPETVYDPSLKLQAEPIIYTPQGMTKSELKAHRKLEHERWKKLCSNQMVVQQPRPAEGASTAASVADLDFDSDASFPDTDEENDEDDED